MRTGSHGIFRTFQVGRQRRDSKPLDLERLTHQVCAIRHLRQKLARHEGANLDLWHAGFGFALDPSHFAFRGKNGVDAL